MTAISKASAFPKSVQPGIPALGPKPAGWDRGPLSNHLFEQQRPVQMEDDTEYRLVTVKRSRGGVVSRENLKGHEISVKSQFLLHPGDFLISKRQIVHGACGIVPAELEGSIASNEYAILRSKPTVDLNFLNYLAHSIYFQQTCFHSSIGVHVEKMIFKLDRWLSWDFDLPPISEQRRIAEILSMWDVSIAAQERLITNAQAQTKALMQTLLTQKKRLPGFKEEWQETTLSKVVKIEWGNTSLTKKAYLVDGFPAFSASGQDGYVDQAQWFGEGIVLSAIGARCGRCFWAEGSWTAIKNTIVIQGIEGVSDPKFLFLLLDNPEFWPISGGAQPFIGLQNARLIRMLLPPYVEQTKIALIIGNASRRVAALQQGLNLLKKEKSALMQQLLTGKRRVKIEEVAA